MTTAWQDRLYLGTWQFGGQFRSISEKQIAEVIDTALALGICRFDTASVYGNGRVEALLGSYLPKDMVVVTKIPAKEKPPLSGARLVADYYPEYWVKQCVEASLSRLGRQRVDVLFHNWSRGWAEDSIGPVEILCGLRAKGSIARIGISLPDNFGSGLCNTLLDLIDFIEAPYNLEQSWVIDHIPFFLSRGKEVLLRSIFKQGLLVMNEEAHKSLEHSDMRAGSSVRSKGRSDEEARILLLQAWELNTSLIIGMTNCCQVRKNVAYLKDAWKRENG